MGELIRDEFGLNNRNPHTLNRILVNVIIYYLILMNSSEPILVKEYFF